MFIKLNWCSLHNKLINIMQGSFPLQSKVSLLPRALLPIFIQILHMS